MLNERLDKLHIGLLAPKLFPPNTHTQPCTENFGPATHRHRDSHTMMSEHMLQTTGAPETLSAPTIFFRVHPRHMEVPRLGVESEL